MSFFKTCCQWAVIMMMGFHPSGVSATPPDSVDIQYNQDNQTMTLTGRHVTQDRLEHFIRRINVTINQQEPQKFYLTRQDSNSEFKKTIPVKLEPGDMVKIDVFCSKGGTRTAEFQVPRVTQGEVKDKTGVEDLKAVKDNDHQNMPIIP